MNRFKLALRVLFDKKFSQSLMEPETPRIEAPAPPAPTPEPVGPLRSDAISLLATLQREARLIDFLQEDISAYADEQIGAAVRDVHRESRQVLDRLLGLKPVVAQEDGTQVDIPKDSAGRYQLSGNVTTAAARGTLVHPGWQASHCKLPKWTGSESAALIVSPAEVEV